jgi:cellulose synthase operon protein C
MRARIIYCLRLATVLITILGCLLFTGCTKKRSRKYFEKGQQLAQSGDCKSAEVQLAKAIDINPNYADPHWVLAECAIRYTDSRRAYYELQTVTELTPDNLDARVAFGELLLTQADLENAKREIDYVIGRDPTHLGAHLLQAKLLMQLEKWDAARAEINKAASLAPAKPEPLVLEGTLERMQSRFAESEQALMKAKVISPQSSAVWIALGRTYQAQSKWSEAEQAYKSAVAGANPEAYEVLTSFYLARDDRHQAEAVAKAAQAALPDLPRAYRLPGNLYTAIHELDRAAEEFARVLQAHPEDRRVRKNRSQLLLLTDHLEQASEATFEVEREDPNDPESVVLQVQVELQRGHPEVVKKLAENALYLQEKNAMARFYLGIVLLQRGDFGAGDREIKQSQALVEQSQKLRAASLDFNDIGVFNSSSQRIAEIQPLSPEGYASLAELEIGRGHLDKAEQWLQDAIRFAPANPAGYAKLAEVRVLQGNNSEAEQLFEKALAQDADDPQSATGLTDLYVKQNQPAKALGRLEAQVAKAPDSSALQVVLAKFYADQGNLAFAGQASAKALKLDPKNADAYLVSSRIMRTSGKLRDATQLIEGWVQASPSPRGYVELGELYEADGKWQQAQESFQAALKSGPGFNIAADNLARSLMEHDGNTDVAVTLITQARANEPVNPRFADTLGWAYYKKGLYRSARPLLEEAVYKMPNNAEARYHLGLTYRKLAETSKAEEELKQVLRLDPGFKHADVVKDNLASLNPKQFGTNR